MHKYLISVVVPVYGGINFLDELCDRLNKSLSSITSSYEIILVDDRSADNPWNKIHEISETNNHVKGIKLSRNFGQHYAITAGLEHSKGEWVVVMDCDLQDQPEEIGEMFNKALEGYDIVFGRREHRQDSFLKKLGSKMFYKLFSYLTETKQDGTIANFGVYNHKVINSLLNMRENLRFFPTMVKWVGFKSISVDIEHSKRSSGKSGYSFKKLLKLAFDVMLSFSDKPLRLMVKMGIVISLLSLIYALFIIVRVFLGINGLLGWPSLIVSIWFSSGIIIFILGIIGLYISRIFEEVKSRPLYIVDDLIDKTIEIGERKK